MVQAIEKQNTKETDPYLEKFARFETSPHQPVWVFPLRKAGIASFAEQGFPTLKHEDWRYTNVAPIAKLPFQPAFETSGNGTAAKDVANRSPFRDLNSHRLVFVNGHYSAELSSLRPLPNGVKAGSLAAALAKDSSFLEKHLGRYAQTEGNAFTALNQAFSSTAHLFMFRPVSKWRSRSNWFISPRHTRPARRFIRATSSSRRRTASSTVIESYVSTGNAAYFTNAVTEIVAGENAARRAFEISG